MEAQALMSLLEAEEQKSAGNIHEDTQHLMELGYLPMLQINAFFPKQISLAKQQFLEELSQTSLFSQKELELYQKIGAEAFVTHFLRRVTDIDEGVQLASLPQKNSVNLYSRIIHYRLDVVGLWIQPFTVKSPFSHLSLIQLGILSQFTKTSNLEAINAIGNIEGFTQQLLKVHPEEDFILSIKTQQVNEDLQHKLDRKGAFKRQLIEDFGDRSEFFIYLKKNILKENADRIDTLFLDKESREPFKQFVLRLVQVHQWKDGFYDGLLDSDLGNVSLQSTLDCIDFYNAASDRDIKSFRVLTYLTDSFFLFNALFFLQEYAVEQQQKPSNFWEGLGIQVEKAKPEDQKQFESNLEKLRSQTSQNQEPEQRKGLLVRIYYGAINFIKKLAGIVKKVFKWIANEVTKFWKLLKSTFRDFFENLKTGIHAFVDGIKFVLGRKLTFTPSDDNNDFAISKFSIDGDVTSLVSGLNTSVIQKHIQHNRYLTSTIGFSLTVVANVLKLVWQSLSAICWPLLLINIVKAFKNIKASFQTLHLETA